MTYRFLLLEENPLDADIIKATLTSGGIDCEFVRVQNQPDFITALSSNVFDLILADYALSSFDDLSALSLARSISPEVPFIFVCGSSCSQELEIETVIETLKSGATDYVLKERLGRLVPSVERALQEAREGRKRKRAELMLVEQKRLLELIATGHSLDECLTAVCTSVSKLNPCIQACFLLTDVQRLRFKSSITPAFAPSFGQGLKDAPINDLCFGTCGTAVYSGQPIMCHDIASDERWSPQWRDLCIAHGIKACHSTPVRALDGLPFGSLMLCFAEARIPTDWEHQLADFGSHVASIVFERECVNLALCENETRLRTVAANLPNAAVFIVDRNLRYVLAEGQALLGAGVTSVDLVGKTLWEALEPNLAIKYEPYYRSCLGGQPFSLEHCSHQRYYISHCTPLYNGQGEIDAVLAVSYDTTVRKRAELNAEFLATVSQDLVGATTVDEIVQTIGEQLNRYFNTSICAFVEINEGAQQAVVNHDWHQFDVASLVGTYFLREFVTDEFLQIAQSGQPLIVGDVNNDPRIADASRYAALKIGAELNIPLIRDGEWKFSLTVFHQAAYNWSEDEVQLMQELTSRIWAQIERARAEAALRESEQQSRNIIESITDAFFAVDENWRFTYINQTAYTLVNRPPGDLMGKIFWEEFPGVNDSQFEQMHRRVMHSGVAESLTAFYPDHNRWYEVRSYPATSGITMYFRNVTEQIQAEAALRESEEKSRNILESIAEAFFALDQDWCFTYMNQSGEALLNRSPGELIGKNFWEEYPGLIGNEFETVYRKAMQDRMVGTLTAFYPDHNRWYEVRSYPATKGIAVYFNDVTVQIQAQEASQKSQARFRNIFDSKMIGMGIWTRSGGIIDANDALLDIIGYTRQDLEGRGLNWQEITPPEYHWLDEQALAEIAINATCSSYEKEYIHKQGKRIPILIGGGVFADTKDMGVFFAIDLTERKQAEAQREQLLQQEQAAREAAERANRIKDEFLTILSHELRSPLNPILGWTNLLLKGKLDAANQAKALTTIERNAKLQAQLIEDLLDISRIMQGKLSLNAESVNLAFVIEAALEIVHLAAEAKNIQLTLDLDWETASIFGDAARLQQVVWNLLTNAVKFTPSGGQVRIELRQIESLAQLRVIDTGKGINPQFLPYVFEYFRQEDSSTTRKFGGLGLGLAIVRQIVEMHGGTVRVESQGENQGATFIVQLPAVQQAMPHVNDPICERADLETSLHNLQILLVDDDTDTREFQAFLLTQNGAKVTAVATAFEALQALDRFIPDILVSDIGMEQMDGYMLMREIRSRPSARGGIIPAIAVTAYAGEIDYQQAMAAGFQLHLSKPIDSANLIKAILSIGKPAARS